MGRLHLLEIHEQPWCPAVIRNGATDYLRFIATVGQQYKQVVPFLQRALHASNSERIVDLCSGSAGPWQQIQPALSAKMDAPIPILLTDLYPDKVLLVAQSDSIRFVNASVNALQIPPDLTGFRTMFTAFHHFRPSCARAILQDAVDSGQGIGVFEQTARTPLALLIMLFLPWISILAAPFVRPLRWSRLFWTLVIPLIPIVLCFDGIVSCLRTYSVVELQALVDALHPSAAGVAYRWEIGRAPSPLSPIGITYALGYPICRVASTK